MIKYYEHWKKTLINYSSQFKNLILNIIALNLQITNQLK